jgi:hypothetical protein
MSPPALKRERRPLARSGVAFFSSSFDVDVDAINDRRARSS